MYSLVCRNYYCYYYFVDSSYLKFCSNSEQKSPLLGKVNVINNPLNSDLPFIFCHKHWIPFPFQKSWAYLSPGHQQNFCSWLCQVSNILILNANISIKNVRLLGFSGVKYYLSCQAYSSQWNKLVSIMVKTSGTFMSARDGKYNDT